MNTRYPSFPSQGPTPDEAAAPGPARKPEAAPGSAQAETPRLVTRGESSEQISDSGERWELQSNGRRAKLVAIPLPRADGHPFAALTDYLNITFPFDRCGSSVGRFFGLLRGYLGDVLGGLTDRGRGLHGYESSFAFDKGGALFAHGGQAGTAFISLPGEACALIPDWQDVIALFGGVLKGRITRWDGAVDDFEGQYTVDQAVTWYKTGRFTAGGNKPACSQSGNWIEPDGKGRTFYVGSRENGKLMRVYEKGKQLRDPKSPWVRWELELHNRDREIPFAVLLEPGRYVAGSYRCMRWVREEARRIRTIQRTGEIGYAHLLHYARLAYGRLINVALEAEGSPEAVIEKIRRDGTPARLDLPGLKLAGEPGE